MGRSWCARRLRTPSVMCLGLAFSLCAALAQDEPIPGAQSSGVNLNKPARFQIWRAITLGTYKGWWVASGTPLVGPSLRGRLFVRAGFSFRRNAGRPRLAGAMEPSPVLPICFVGKGGFRKTMLIRTLTPLPAGAFSDPVSSSSRWEPTRSPSLLPKFVTGTIMDGDDQ
jgi:hypothetical protein